MLDLKEKRNKQNYFKPAKANVSSLLALGFLLLVSSKQEALTGKRMLADCCVLWVLFNT